MQFVKSNSGTWELNTALNVYSDLTLGRSCESRGVKVTKVRGAANIALGEIIRRLLSDRWEIRIYFTGKTTCDFNLTDGLKAYVVEKSVDVRPLSSFTIKQLDEDILVLSNSKGEIINIALDDVTSIVAYAAPQELYNLTTVSGLEIAGYVNLYFEDNELMLEAACKDLGTIDPIFHLPALSGQRQLIGRDIDAISLEDAHTLSSRNTVVIKDQRSLATYIWSKKVRRLSLNNSSFKSALKAINEGPILIHDASHEGIVFTSIPNMQKLLDKAKALVTPPVTDVTSVTQS